MKTVLQDLLALLYRAQEEDLRSDKVGLGKNEIHPLAYHLKRETDEELFADANFIQGYRGVRSPEIRQILSYFDGGTDKTVILESEDNIEHSDEYFFIVRDADRETAQERLDELDEDTKQEIDNAIESLNDNWLDFVKRENHSFENETSPDPYSVPS